MAAVESAAMRICFLSCLYANERLGGGVRTYIESSSRALAGMGHEVTVVTGGPAGHPHEDDGVRIVNVGEVRILSGETRMFDPSFVWKRLRYMMAAARYIQQGDFDVVEVPDGGFEHLFFAHRRLCPLVVRLHSNVVDHKRTAIRWPLELAQRLVLRSADALSALSPSSARDLARRYRIDERRFSVIPVGIDLNRRFTERAVRTLYGLEGKKIVLFVGMLCQRKGVDLLLRLAERNQHRRDVRFVMIGAPLEAYDTQVFPENVLQLGYRPLDELLSFYSQCDLFFSPSRHETFGLSVLEAMSFGKPILAASATGLRDLVSDGGNGYLFDVDDSAALSKKFDVLIERADLLEQFGRESKKLASQYEISRVARATERFYRQVADVRREA